ncbi:MAG TPA: polysaccharide biosynthesis tyrosine autokinase [Acidimicrobiales bacterium]|nr:polysaccharide biosynthesis tyrosine autokinase [Acidimicrobiales bacterium]
MGVSEHLRVVWRRKWRILAVALVLAGIVHVRSDATPDEYRAVAVLAVVPGGADAGSDAAGRLARSYAVLAETRPVVGLAVEQGDLRVGASAARDQVEARANDDGFVEVTGDGSTPARAERLAASVGDALVATVESRQESARAETVAPAVAELEALERQIGSRDLAPDAPLRTALLARFGELHRAVTEVRLRPLDRVEVVSPARAATAPVAPAPARDGLLTFLGALAAFSLLAVLVEAFSDRFSTERPAEEATRMTGLPVLAEIPRTGGAEVVEAFRTLRTSLMFMSTSERLRTLAVVSVDPGAGKSATALNLAREAAALEVPVVLIDGDLRRPVLHERLDLPRSPGLSEALSGASDAETAGHLVQGWLRVVTSGALVADPAGLFGGRAFREALDGMSWAELVVVDTPAGGLFADALAIASQCDATLVVVDAERSKRRPVRELVESLRHVSAQPIGIVLNRTEPAPRPSYYEVRAEAPAKR